MEETENPIDVRPFDSFEEALKIASILNDCNVTWAFVGGIAVAVHGYIRATEDVDVVILLTDLKKIDSALKKEGYIINEEPIKFNDGFELFRRVLIRGSFYFVLDLLISPEQDGIFEGCLFSKFQNKDVRVISKSKLLQMKRSAGRPKDILDIDALTKG